MATAPGLLDEALAAVVVAFELNANWAAHRIVTEGDPEDEAPPSEWPDGTRVLVLLTPTGGEEWEAERGQKGVESRDQVGRYEAIVWARDDTAAARAATWETVRRTALNALEGLNSTDWWVRWRSWSRQDAPAPYAGVRIQFEVLVYE